MSRTHLAAAGDVPADGVAPDPAARLEHHSPSPVLDAIDLLADGYYELDPGFRYRRVNQSALRIAGKTAAEMLGKHVLEVFPEVASDPIHQTTQRVMESRQAESVETYYAPRHGWYVNSIYPVADGIAIFSRDTTEQKLLAQNLAFLAEASKILSSSLDYQQTLRSVARLAVPRIADWCAVDMLTGPHTVELLAVAHVDPEKIRWAEELRQRDPVDLDRPTGLAKVVRTGRSEFYPEITDELLVATAKDERTLELARGLGFSSAMIVPLMAQNRAIGALSFVAASSGRHYTQSDLAMAEELASRAALAIENSGLYGASQRAVSLRDDFIVAASHELRTPVTSLKIYTEVLQRQAAQRGDEQVSRQLGKMLAQIERLAGLIGDLLDVSRIEAGRLELRREAVDLRRLVDDVVDAVQATTTRHLVTVHGHSRPVLGDRERLGQVLTNLLTNAVKFSPRADRVVVRLVDGEEGAVIEVEDFGIGLDPEHLPRVFDRFYRVSSPDEKTYPGLGMGLAIAHEIVRRHDGALEVASEKGQGTVFRVILPYGDLTDMSIRPEGGP